MALKAGYRRQRQASAEAVEGRRRQALEAGAEDHPLPAATVEVEEAGRGCSRSSGGYTILRYD